VRGGRHAWHVEEVPNGRRLRAVNLLVGTGVTILAPDPPLAHIHRSAWKRNSPKLDGQARLSLTIPPNGEPLILMRDNEGYERNIDV
jgi:hypothetical protein